MEKQSGCKLQSVASEAGAEGLKCASIDRAELPHGIGRGSGCRKLGGNINNDTDLVLGDETDLILGGTSGDEGDLELYNEAELILELIFSHIQ